MSDKERKDEANNKQKSSNNNVTMFLKAKRIVVIESKSTSMLDVLAL